MQVLERETIDSPHPLPAQVESVAKAARVLRCFGPGDAPLTVRHIAERTGLPRSTDSPVGLH